MSANETPEFDPDRTMLVPSPGGKRAAVASAAPAPDEQTRMFSPPPPPPPPPASAPATATGSVSLAGAASVPNGSSPGPGLGLNPLVRAANPLFDLLTPLRSMTSHPDVEQLRMQLVGAIKQFEAKAKAAHVGHDALAAARFSLCTLLDEAISSTPWGGGGVWASRSLLVAFHNEASGGEKFFLILHKLAQDVPANLHVLELMYLCLALGLEGRYRVIENGRSQLEVLRERLQQLLQTQRGPFEPQLSPHWQGASGKGEPLWRMVPVWILAAGAAVVFIVVQLGLSWRLNQFSDPVFTSLHQIRFAPALALAPTLPTPTLPAKPAPVPVRIAGFLASEVERGLLSVNETADRSIVTLRGDGVFASGSAEVTAEFAPLLRRIGDAIKPLAGRVVVIGHTDNVKGGISARFPSNWDLSKGRANAVKALLAERAGPLERYTVEGRGDTEPLAANDSPANRARNRRVDIIVLMPPQSP